MFESTTWMTLFAVGMLGVLLLGFGPFGPFGIGATLFAMAAGPLVLGWLFLMGPPERGSRATGTWLLGLAGVALCVTALFKLPFFLAFLLLG
ncbi:MAG: hypothetical protein H6735_21830 [Alphaproteobacteria bacterium]|nr:hypothetical protein [Alphaproteobacteria bacterium]